MIGQVNINSLNNKIEFLKEIVQGKVDVLMISKTKLCSSFPEAKFYMGSYSKSHWLDRIDKRGGIMLYVMEIPSNLIQPFCLKLDKEYILVEINLRRKKLLLVCNYNLHQTLIKDYLGCINKEINCLSIK